MRETIKVYLVGIIYGLILGFILALACVAQGYISISSPSSEARVEHEQSSGFLTFDDLLDAIEWVESRGDVNAVGDNGNAVGSFQIWKIYVDDLNRIRKLQHKDKYSTPLQYEYYQRKSRVCSRWMVKRYLEHYATKERIGREPTFEDMARIHNGGPDGWKKEPTKAYWLKVKERLAEGEPE